MPPRGHGARRWVEGRVLGRNLLRRGFSLLNFNASELGFSTQLSPPLTTLQ